MKVKELMHKDAEWVEPGTSISEVARKMRDLDIGAMPIGENDRLIGMITDRDITCRAVADGADPSKVTARDVMTKGIIYCTESEEVEDAVRIMEDKRIRRMPVIDSNKRMVGMLSLGDLSHGAPRPLVREVMEAVSEHHA